MRVASKIIGEPLLVLPSVAQEIGEYIRSRQTGNAPIKASRLSGVPRVDPHDPENTAYRVDGGVAVCSIVGELVNRGAYLGASSGLVSYEGVQEQVRLAGQDADAHSIVVDLSSPGGEAYGMVDTAKSLKTLANGKPIIAVVNSLAASAAYGLACGADEIVIGESGMVGSIGVVILHMDQSAALDGMGLRATFIHAGDKKVLGNSFETLSDAALEHLQSKVDEVMTGFVDLVASARPNLNAEEIYNFEADTFYGQKAVDVGLADRIGTVQSVVHELNSAQSGRTTSHKKGLFMSDNQGKPAATGVIETEANDHTAALAAAFSEGKTEGKAEGVAAEGERYKAVLSADGVAGDGPRMVAALDMLSSASGMDAEAITAHVVKHTPAATKSETTDVVQDYDNQRAMGSELAAPGSTTKVSALSQATSKALGK